MARRFSVPVISSLAAIVALVLVAPQSDPAEGAIPNKNGVYRACLTKKTGAVKVIDYPKRKCAKGQRLIKWNLHGHMGAQGPQGIQGIQGPAGQAGITRINLSHVFTDPASTSPEACRATSPRTMWKRPTASSRLRRNFMTRWNRVERGPSCT